jgi:branched-subunit amino acid aminotransferase/4-amino-4-deoxychorismate lyase
MTPPLQREELKVLLAEVVAKNLQNDYDGDLLIDVIFSGGLDGSSMKQSGKGAHLYVAVQKLIPPPPEAYRDGVTLATFKHQRLCPDVKLLNYIGAILAHQTVVPEHNAFEVLFVDPADNDSVLEGSTFTVFFIDTNGVIKTPPLNGKILDSVTRRVLLELLHKNRIACEETPVSLRELDSFTECFLVSTTRNVLPVVRIDAQIVGTGKPGPLTAKIMSLIEEYVRSY